MKKLFYFLFTISCVCLSSCNSDEPEEILDPTIPLYQEYEVNFYENGVTNVFANFRKHNQFGQSVKLNNGAKILANDFGMIYFRSSDYADLGVESNVRLYDYTAQMAVDEVVFDFYRSQDTKITNKVSSKDITNVKIPENLSQIHNGEPIKVGEEPIKQGEKLVTRLVSLSNNQMVYDAKVSIYDMTAVFNNVPVGIYQLQVMNSKVIATTQNDRDAFGVITIYYLDNQQVSIVAV